MDQHRASLNTLLITVLGSNNVYFQPPASVRLNYPAIVYSRKDIDNVHADDSVYSQMQSYQVTVIDRDPDSAIVKQVSKLKYCRHQRHYSSDNLYHDSFTLYY